MPADLTQGPLRLSVPLREFGDLRDTIRITDWTAGMGLQTLQPAFGVLQTTPGYLDSQNIDPYSVPGTFRLCSRWNRIGSADASDFEFLLYPFNNAVYWLPTANFSAAQFQKSTQATGTATKVAPANPYPGVNACRNAVVWRDQFVVAGGETVLRVMSSAEVWTTIAAPGAVTAPICGQVGITQQDQLACWWEGSAGSGMYTYDGTAWTKLFPPAGVTAPVSATCDMIVNATGSLLFATRDSSGITRLYEYMIETTGSVFAVWFTIPGIRFWPQGGTVLGDLTFLVGRTGTQQSKGKLWRKGRGVPPESIFEFDTNFGTDNQKGLDWAARCITSIGDVAYIGASSGYDHTGMHYRLTSDADGQILHPLGLIDVLGPIYSIAAPPYSVSGASSTERLFCSGFKASYYKDAENGADPTTDAASGFIQMPDIDLGSADHLHVWKVLDLDLLLRSTGGTVSVEYRRDPTKGSDPWTALAPPSGGIRQGPNHMPFPDDNASQRLRGTAARVLQIRVKLTAASSGTVRDVVDTLAAKWARTRPLGSTV